MKPYLNILVGINYTDASRHALREAKRIADENGAKITACHVVPLGEINEFVNFYMIEHKIMINAAKSSLEGFIEEVCGRNHDIVCQISEGIPHHELVSKANEEGHDLLVLGDDDYADDSRKAGQFAIKCLRFATMPVLLVNRPPVNTRSLVAACIDFSKSTSPVLENAALLISGEDARLQIIHASRPPWLHPFRLRYQKIFPEDHGQQEQYREILEGQLLNVRNMASSFYHGEIESIRLESEDPAESLLNHFQTTGCTLVVIGRSGKGVKGLVSDLLGGTAAEVIRHAECPILIVPVKN